MGAVQVRRQAVLVGPEATRGRRPATGSSDPTRSARGEGVQGRKGQGRRTGVGPPFPWQPGPASRPLTSSEVADSHPTTGETSRITTKPQQPYNKVSEPGDTEVTELPMV